MSSPLSSSRKSTESVAPTQIATASLRRESVHQAFRTTESLWRRYYAYEGYQMRENLVPCFCALNAGRLKAFDLALSAVADALNEIPSLRVAVPQLAEQARGKINEIHLAHRVALTAACRVRQEAGQSPDLRLIAPGVVASFRFLRTDLGSHVPVARWICSPPIWALFDEIVDVLEAEESRSLLRCYAAADLLDMDTLRLTSVRQGDPVIGAVARLAHTGEWRSNIRHTVRPFIGNLGFTVLTHAAMRRILGRYIKGASNSNPDWAWWMGI